MVLLRSTPTTIQRAKTLSFFIFLLVVGSNLLPLQTHLSPEPTFHISPPEGSSVDVPADFILGGDVSSYPQVIDGGGIYHFINGTPGDLYDILTPIGFKFGRLRLWVDPTNVEAATLDYGNYNHTRDMAQLLTSKGWEYLLNFHYSDWWADPSQQTKPHEWENQTFSTLVDQIYNYTYEVLTDLKIHDALPAMIQTGNEIIHGMLWPDGGFSNLTQFAQLLNSSRVAIENFCVFNNMSQIPIMIHIPADSWSSTELFFDSLSNLGVACDIIGLSYYPKWHGEMASLENILNSSATKYHKPLIVVETSYLHGLYYENPDGGFWGEDDILEGYTASPEGQRSFLEDVIRLVINTPEGLGKGVVLWEPAWIYPCVGGTTMQDRGVFGLDDLLLDVYANPLVNIPISTETPTPTTTSDPDPDDTPKISAFPMSGFIASVGILFLWQIIVQKKKLRPRNPVVEKSE